MKKKIGFWVAALALMGLSVLGLTSCNVAESGDTHILRMQLDDSLAVESNLFKTVDIDLFDSSGNMTHANVFSGPYSQGDSAKLANLVLTSKIPNPVTIRVTAYKNNDDYWIFTIQVADGVRKVLPPVHKTPSDPVDPDPVDSQAPNRIIITSPTTSTLYLGDPSISLSASAEPPTAVQTVTWTLSSGDAAILESGDKLKALKTGTVTLTATSILAPSVTATLVMTVTNAPTESPASVVINNGSPLSLTVGGASVALNASVLPAEAKQDIKWTLPSNTVAVLEPGNQIKGLKAGTVTLTASSAIAPSVFDTLVVTVQDAPTIMPDSISLRMATPMVLAVGGADIELVWTVLPAGADQGMDWSSSDTTIAQVIGGNKIRPLKKGPAKITGKSKVKPSITTFFDVNVIVPVKVDAISILPKNLTLYTGGPEGKLAVTLTGNDSGAQYTLSSSEDLIASVSAAGSVKGLAAGSAIITAAVVGYPAITSACTVQVIKDSPVVTVSPNQNVAFNGEAEFTVSVGPQAYGTTVEIKADMDGDNVFEQTVLNKETADFKQKYTEIKTTTVSFKVKDTEGNEVTVTRKVTVGAPGAPIVSIVNPSKDTTINVLSLKIRFTVKDTSLKIDTLVDSTVTLIAGSNKVRAARKYASEEGSDEVTILVDNVAPVVAITGAATRTTGTAAFTLDGTASDLSPGLQSVTISGALSGNGAVTVTAGEWSKSLTLAEGANTLVATALDKAGNSKTASITVILDNKKPAAPTVTAPAAVRTASITWKWTTLNPSNGSGKFKVKINDGAEIDAPAPEYTLADAGMDTGTYYSLVVKETDPISGDGPWSPAKKVLYDSKKPDPKISVALSNTSAPTWTWEGNGGVGSFRWYYKATTPTYLGNNLPTKTFTMAAPAAGTEATYNLCVQEKDSPEWGEEWGAEKCASILVDKKPPTITNPGNKTITSTSTTLTFSATDGTGTGVKTASCKWGTTTVAADLSGSTWSCAITDLTTAQTTVTLEAVDGAGLKGTATLVITVNLPVQKVVVAPKFKKYAIGLNSVTVEYTLDGASKKKEFTSLKAGENILEIVGPTNALGQSSKDNAFVYSLPNVVFVDKNAAGTQKGDSWENAFTSLNAALISTKGSASGTDIWLTSGTYGFPEGDITFWVSNGVELFGGFPIDGSGVSTQSMNMNDKTTLSASSSFEYIVTLNSNTTLNNFNVMRENNPVYTGALKVNGINVKVQNSIMDNWVIGDGIYVTITDNASVTFENSSLSKNDAPFSSHITIGKSCTVDFSNTKINDNVGSFADWPFAVVGVGANSRIRLLNSSQIRGTNNLGTPMPAVELGDGAQMAISTNSSVTTPVTGTGKSCAGTTLPCP